MDRSVIRGKGKRKGWIYSSNQLCMGNAKKKRTPFLTAKAGQGHRSIKEPTELVEPAGATPLIIRHVRQEAHRSTCVGILPQEGTQGVCEL